MDADHITTLTGDQRRRGPPGGRSGSKIVSTGPLGKKRMQTIDDEVTAATLSLSSGELLSKGVAAWIGVGVSLIKPILPYCAATFVLWDKFQT